MVKNYKWMSGGVFLVGLVYEKLVMIIIIVKVDNKKGI